MDDNNVNYTSATGAIVEDDTNADVYPDDYDNGSSGMDKSIKKMVGLLIAVLLILVVFVAIYFGMKKGKDKRPDVATPTSAEAGVTVDAAPETVYQPGDYIVLESSSTRLRKEPSENSEHLVTVPAGTHLTITEIYIDEKATDPTMKYWGKTDYKGWVSWVPFSALEKSGMGVTTDPAGETTSGAEGETTAASAETTTDSAAATTKPASVSTGTYSTGEYIVTADEFLRVREDHDVSSESITQIDKDEKITILDIYCDEDADDPTLKYWGKVSYGGYVGWVSMHYTQAAN